MIKQTLPTRSVISLFLALGFLLLVPTRTAAWGPKGHQVIALIAMERLSPSARQAIAETLNGQTLESVANWADQIKAQQPNTRSWHFVPINYGDVFYARTKHCARNETCIIEAIGQQIAILRKAKSPAERADALRFVVHLIGDLHQPFHVTTNTNPHDDSAAKVRVPTLNGKTTSLRDLWGNDLVDYGMSKSSKSVQNYATNLSNKYRRSNISAQGSVTDWALEAHRLTRNNGGPYYDSNNLFMVADNNRAWVLGNAYYDKNLQLVEIQMVRAGTRLAKVLNEVFGAKAAY